MSTGDLGTGVWKPWKEDSSAHHFTQSSLASPFYSTALGALGLLHPPPPGHTLVTGMAPALKNSEPGHLVTRVVHGTCRGSVNQSMSPP